MKYALILLCLVLFSCYRTPDIPDPGPIIDEQDQQITNEVSSTNTVEEKEAKVAQLKARLAAAEADLSSYRKAAQQQKLENMQNTAYWVAGISMLIVFGCAAALVILTIQGVAVGRKLIIGFGVAGLVVASIAIAYAQIIPYLKWIGLAFLSAAVVYAIYYFYKLVSINEEHAKVGVDALWELITIRDSFDTPDEVKKKVGEKVHDIKNEARKRQAKKGIHNDIHKIIKKHKQAKHIPEKLKNA